MSEQEIIEGNKLIAEFMGYEYISGERSHADYGWWKKGFFEEGNSRNNSNFICISSYHLKYNTSWDWLMPVVEKIETTDPLGGIVTIQQGMCKITSRMLGDNSVRSYFDNYLLMGAKGKLLSAYQAVIAYIKWYNENDTSKTSA